jgi:hypothetical protein
MGGNYTLPTFKVFINDPDITVYPSANAPSITDSVRIVGGNIYYGQSAQFTIGVSAPGTLQLIISLNGVSGYQAGTSDVLVVANVVAGMNTINWDGKDAYGNYPPVGTSIEISTGFSAGVTHLPIYDPETHTNGFVVDRVRPGSGSAPIRWDDSNFASGTVNISGGSGNGHSWSTNFGDVRTMNTWWNGYEVENQDQFTVIIKTPLPVELLSFIVKLNSASHPVLSWSTASEINLDYFTIERSSELNTAFTKVGVVKGNGNSTKINYYQFEDNQPMPGYLYYRVKAVTYDGIISYSSKIEKVYRVAPVPHVDIFPNPAISEIKIKNEGLIIREIEISDEFGKRVYYSRISNQESQITIDVSRLIAGMYFVRVFDGVNVYNQKLAIGSYDNN